MHVREQSADSEGDLPVGTGQRRAGLDADVLFSFHAGLDGD